jgi:nicotinamidase-related amidase
MREKREAAAASPAFGPMNGRFEFDTADALVVIDVINDFEHEDGDRLLASFKERLTAMTEALASARAAGVPIIYVNDERSSWDSDAPALIRAALENKRGAGIVEHLAPHSGDRVLLKHRYSAFDHTPLDLLLEQLHIDRLVLIGAATEGCIVQTAIDAREHGLKTTIIADACAGTDPELEAIALEYAGRVVGARIAHGR